MVGVDKLGMRPLYWMPLTGGGYAVASELKVLVCIADKLEINWSAWEEHLTFGYLFGNHTFFSGIARLGPSELLTFRDSSHQSKTVENFLENIEICDRTKDDFLEDQADVFDNAMNRLTS